MLLRNFIDGSKGVIVGMSRGFPIVLFENGDRETVRPVEYEVDIKNVGRLTRNQIPLKLAW